MKCGACRYEFSCEVCLTALHGTSECPLSRLIYPYRCVLHLSRIVCGFALPSSASHPSFKCPLISCPRCNKPLEQQSAAHAGDVVAIPPNLCWMCYLFFGSKKARAPDDMIYCPCCRRGDVAGPVPVVAQWDSKIAREDLVALEAVRMVASYVRWPHFLIGPLPRGMTPAEARWARVEEALARAAPALAWFPSSPALSLDYTAAAVADPSSPSCSTMLRSERALPIILALQLAWLARSAGENMFPNLCRAVQTPLQTIFAVVHACATAEAAPDMWARLGRKNYPPGFDCLHLAVFSARCDPADTELINLLITRPFAALIPEPYGGLMHRFVLRESRPEPTLPLDNRKMPPELAFLDERILSSYNRKSKQSKLLQQANSPSQPIYLDDVDDIDDIAF